MKTVSIPLPNNEGEVIFEITDSDQLPKEEGLTRTRGESNVNEKNISDLGSLLKNISPVIKTLRQSLNDINNPSEVSIDFGVKIGGKTGVIFSSIEAEANFKISVKWSSKG